MIFKTIKVLNIVEAYFLCLTSTSITILIFFELETNRLKTKLGIFVGITKQYSETAANELTIRWLSFNLFFRIQGRSLVENLP